MVCGRRGCGHHGHCLWPLLSNRIILVVANVVVVVVVVVALSLVVVPMLFYSGYIHIEG